ncbi:hypothetical protein ACFTSF_25275 [Kribbella sp. NPDC056951]|uniref:hypothetical protein n=1 Tax=Kribbella sp. NPDC056951 TaxID=3345978 RepID=UPI00363F7C3F
MSGSRFIDLVRSYLDRSNLEARDWEPAFDVARNEDIVFDVGDRSHWLRLYRQRFEESVERGDAAASGLGRVVNDLNAYNGDSLQFALLSLPSHGYMVWMSDEPAMVISCLRVADRRAN